MTHVGGLGAAVLVAAASLAAQQPQPPRFRASVEIVRLDVTVLDQQRRPIRDLKREDFTVLVDGVEQPVVAFERVVIPPADHNRAAWTREVSADVRDNQVGEPRIFIIVLDDANTPHNDLWMVRTGKETARAIVDEMRPGDLAAVVFTFNTRHAQDLTQDRATLLAAIDKFTPQAGIPAAHAMVWNTVNNLFKVMRQRSLGARAAIMWISPYAPGQRRLRVDRGFGEEREDVFALISDMNQLSREARVSNLPFYGFNIAGLVAPIPQRPVAPSLNDSLRTLYYTYEEAERVNDSLRYLAKESGGRAVVNTNAPAVAVPDIINEMSAYYVLGYRATYLTNDHLDARHTADARMTLPLSTLQPGEYLLRVEAASSDRRVEAAKVRFFRR
jgi:VWFA-related protein